MRKVLAIAVFALFAVANSAQATPIGFAYSSSAAVAGNGALINFDGSGNFSFSNNSLGNTFFVNNLTGVWPDTTVLTGILGDQGNITGTYAIGNITCFLTICTAPVSGTGVFSLTDNQGFTLSANVSWLDITQNGTSSNLNIFGSVNLTNLTYSGTQADYLQWLAATGQTAVLNFTFTPAVTLQQMVSTVQSTTFSGTTTANFTAVPEPATVSLLGMGLMGVAAAVRRRRARK